MRENLRQIQAGKTIGALRGVSSKRVPLKVAKFSRIIVCLDDCRIVANRIVKLISVESSMIRAVGYDRKIRLLEIVFNTGEVYQYEDIPLSEYNGLMKAKSKGAYMQANIIDVYPYYQIERQRLRPRD